MAKGSQTTWEGIPPEGRSCGVCGGKLTISGSRGALWLDTMRGQAYHHQCRLDQLAARGAP